MLLQTRPGCVDFGSSCVGTVAAWSKRCSEMDKRLLLRIPVSSHLFGGLIGGDSASWLGISGRVSIASIAAMPSVSASVLQTRVPWTLLLL